MTPLPVVHSQISKGKFDYYPYYVANILMLFEYCQSEMCPVISNCEYYNGLVSK